jgi:AcrR family transcriptional regulator
MKTNVKERIIEVTIEFLKKEKKVSDVSMRMIAKNADIAVSVINYHFQTKQNLINIAINRYISQVIHGSTTIDEFDNLSTEERIRVSIKNAAEFIVNNPGISRVSVLNDLENPDPKDNSSQLFGTIYHQLETYYKEELSETQLKILVQQQIATVQSIFLRSTFFKEQSGLDFYCKNDREKILDILIDQILRKEFK